MRIDIKMAVAAIALTACTSAALAADGGSFHTEMSRNIFSRLAPPVIITVTGPGKNTTPASIIYSPIFVGAVINQDDAVAFLEDPSTGKVSLVRPGQTITQGTIDAVALGALSMHDVAKSWHVDIGQKIADDVLIPAH